MKLYKKLNILASLVFAITLFASAAPAHAAFPGQNGQIGYSSLVADPNDPGRPSDAPLNRMRFNGTDQQTLFPTGVWFAPRYSADGNKMTVSGRTDGFSVNSPIDVYTLNPDGTNLQNITNYNPTDFPERSDWSANFSSFHPNGTKLTFGEQWTQDFGGGGVNTFTLSTINTDGTNWQHITAPSPDTCDMYPVYSPDGTKIAFYRGDTINRTSGIYTMDADGTNISELVRINNTEARCDNGIDFAIQPERENNPTSFDWSPDGSHIVFVARTGNDSIGTINIETTDLLGNIQTQYTIPFDTSVLNGSPPYPSGSYENLFLLNPQYTPEGQIIFKKAIYSINVGPGGTFDQNDATVQAQIMLINSDGTNLRAIYTGPITDFNGGLGFLEFYNYIFPSVQPITSQTLDWGLQSIDEPVTVKATLANTGQDSSLYILVSLTMLAMATGALILKRHRS